MRLFHLSGLRITLFAAAIAMISGCATSASIRYHQVGACNGYGGPNGVVSAGPNAAYVILGIEGIDNSQTKTNFAYDPSRMCISNLNPAACVDPNLLLNKDILGPFQSVPTTVLQGQQIGFNPNGYGAMVVSTANANGAVEANQTSYFLNQYKVQAGDPNVTFVKTDSSRTSWPVTEDCKQIQLK